MPTRDYFLIVDTETTQPNKKEKIPAMVADFGAIIVDKKGRIHNQCAVLINGIYTNMEKHPLFFTSDPDGIWSKEGQDYRYNMYKKMIEGGTRTIASVAAINIWLAKAKERYDPILTAYKLDFDTGKCRNTGIDLAQFDKQFCLWHAAFNRWAFTKNYRNFVLQMHAFNSPTDIGNLSYKTNAETMARFVTQNPNMEDEPHTALEDALYYELPILTKLVNSTKKATYMKPKPFDWRKVQAKDWFTAK